MKRCQEVAFWLTLAVSSSVVTVHAETQTAPIQQAAAGGQSAQNPQPAPEAQPVTQAVDAKAVAAVKAMGAYLRTLHDFTVQSETIKDEVLDSGQKLQFGSRVTFNVHGPNNLRVDTDSDRQTRQMYYDGKTFTLYSPVLNYYSQVPAPASTTELLALVEERYGIDIPLVDLIYWGSDQAGEAVLTEAMAVGPARIGTVLCDQYAFRQEGVDWQVWIEQGDKPLPRKLVITTISEEAHPQFSALYTWNLQPTFKASTFTFTPPQDAHAIPLVEIEPPISPAQ